MHTYVVYLQNTCVTKTDGLKYVLLNDDSVYVLPSVYERTTPVFDGSTVCRKPAANRAIPKIRIFPKISNRTANHRWMDIVM
jgi:hypothetical protein